MSANYVWKAVKVAGAKPLARSSHSVDAISQIAYVIGGEHQPRIPIGSQVWSLDLKGGIWRELVTHGDEVPARNAHASAVVGQSIYIFGGRQGVAMGEGSLSDMYKLDTSTSKWTKITMTGMVPEARSYHAMTTIGNTVYVFGGCTTHGRLNDLHAFDTDTGVWRNLPSSAEILGRGGAGFTTVGSKLYVIGGFTGKEMGDVHEFDTKNSQWREVKSGLPLPPRSVFGVASLGKRIFAIGGEVDPSTEGHAGAGQYSDEVYMLDTEDDSGWRKVETMGEERMSPRGWFSASAFTDDSVFIFGGNALNNSRLDDAFLLQQILQ